MTGRFAVLGLFWLLALPAVGSARISPAEQAAGTQAAVALAAESAAQPAEDPLTGVHYVPERIRRQFRLGVQASFLRLPAGRVRQGVPADFDAEGVTVIDNGSLHFGTCFGAYVRRDFTLWGRHWRPRVGLGVDPIRGEPDLPVSLKQDEEGYWVYFGKRTLRSQLRRGFVPFLSLDVEAAQAPLVKRMVTVGIATCWRRVETTIPATNEELRAGAPAYRSVSDSIVPVYATVGILLTADTQLWLGSDGRVFAAAVAGDWNWWAKHDKLRESQAPAGTGIAAPR